MALIGDAGHNFGDVLGLATAWGATALARRGPTRRYTYGYGRGTILAALINAVLLLISVGAIATEAVRRLIHPATTQPLINRRRCRHRHSDQRRHRPAVCRRPARRREPARRFHPHGRRCRHLGRRGGGGRTAGADRMAAHRPRGQPAAGRIDRLVHQFAAGREPDPQLRRGPARDRRRRGARLPRRPAGGAAAARSAHLADEPPPAQR